MEVHGQLGCGFLEPVYQEAMVIELPVRQIPFQREVELPICYKAHRLNTRYRADFICCEEIIVEIKALAKLSGNEESQILNYLKATGLEIGLLINFGAKSLEFKSFIRSRRSADSADEADLS
jgi:GxxExxY protein